MKKAELMKAWQEEANNRTNKMLSIADHGVLFETLSSVIIHNLSGGEDVSLPGFGKFSVKETAARKGRNPATGEEIEIPAGRKVVFKPSQGLKEALAK